MLNSSSTDCRWW